MNILPNSDIQKGNSRVYLNNKEQSTNLFFTSDKAKQYYFIMRDEEVIANGLLQGFKLKGVFNYRFNMKNFIKIYNQTIPNVNSIDVYGSFRFVGDNSCNLYLYVGNTDILQQNITSGKLVVESSGRVLLNRINTVYEDLTRDHKVFTTFIDASETDYDSTDVELEYRLETNKIGVEGHYIPVTIYRNLGFKYKINTVSKIYTSEILRKGPSGEHPGYNDGYILTETDGYIWTENKDKIGLNTGMTDFLSPLVGYVTYMIKVPANTKSIDFYIYRMGSTGNILKTYTTTYNVTKECMTPYYFWNGNGTFDTVYCSGVANEVVEVEKEYIDLNGMQIPIKINYHTKIKHNTGLSLKQEQIYSLIKSPIVYKLEIEEDKPMIEKYNIELESFEGYNGINLSERNMELIFTNPKEFSRITNKQITFFD